MDGINLQEILDNYLDPDSENYVIAAGSRADGKLQVHCRLAPDIALRVRDAINDVINSMAYRQ